MRTAFLIAVLVAGAADAEASEERYQQDILALCRERYPVGVAEQCYEVGVESAAIFSAIERGVPVGMEYSLDGDPDRKKAQAIAVECRKRTMDGAHVDVITAMACVAEEIRLQNWAARRAQRLEAEGAE